jgi:hypothetical protein
MIGADAAAPSTNMKRAMTMVLTDRGRQRRSRLLVAMIFVWGIFSLGATELPNRDARYVARVATAVQRAWPDLMQMQDATGFYAEAQILTYDGKQAWLIDHSGYRAADASAVAALRLPYRYPSFKRLQWEQRPTIFLGLEEVPLEPAMRGEGAVSVPHAFLWATHELFHFYGQEGWGVAPHASSRATPFPLRSAPRQYRLQIIRHLAAAAQGQPQALGKARYWFDRWQAEYADEVAAIRYTDIIEGTAMYVESSAELMAAGHERGTADWEAAVTAHLSLLGQAESVSLDEESYPLGVLAGHLMDRQKIDWWAATQTGRTPLEQLLETVPPFAEGDEHLEPRVDEELAQRNRELSAVIDPFVEALNDPHVSRLWVPMATLAGSVGIAGQYRVEGMAEEVFTGFAAQFTPTEGGMVRVDGITTAIELGKMCTTTEAAFMALPLAPQEVPKDSGSRFDLRRNNVEIDAAFPRPSPRQPNDWCL